MDRPRLKLFSSLPILLLAAACTAAPAGTPAGSDAARASSSPSPAASPSPFPATLTDDAGRELVLDAEPMRIVSLAP